MFFVLSKLITVLIMPVSMIVLSFILSFVIKKRKELFRTIGIVLLLFFTNPFFAGMAMRWWEVPPIEIKSISKPYEVGVVLCGVTNPRQKPDDRVHFQKGADRIIHTVQLYKEKKIKKILISGGSGSLLYPEESESDDLYRFALMSGVKKKDILLENDSRNTHENAKYSKLLLKEKGIEAKVLLVTSAFHMRRAQACFLNEGVSFEVFSTDRYSGEMEFTPNSLIVPSLGALGVWTILVKEWLGMVAYKVAGYI